MRGVRVRSGGSEQVEIYLAMPGKFGATHRFARREITSKATLGGNYHGPARDVTIRYPGFVDAICCISYYKREICG